MSLTLSFVLEALLCLLLAVTLIYCVVLERRLSNVQKGQQLLGRTVRDLNVAIRNAGETLSELKTASGEALGELNRRVKTARALADELSVITASGERIAERMDMAVSARHESPAAPPPPPSDSLLQEPADGEGTMSYRSRPRTSGTPQTLMERLDALRTVR